MSEKGRLKCNPSEDFFQLASSDLPVCFCNKPAHPSYTLEFGPVLECANYTTVKEESNNVFNNKKVCIFHVHANSWSNVRDTVLQRREIDPKYRELATCPLYNLTYCSVFHVNNDYDKGRYFERPNCLCGIPAAVGKRINGYAENRPRYYFICEKNAEGTGGCSLCWETSRAMITIPKTMVHERTTEEEYTKRLGFQRRQTESSEIESTEKRLHNVGVSESLGDKMPVTTIAHSPNGDSFVVPASVSARIRSQDSLSVPHSMESSTINLSVPRSNKDEELEGPYRHMDELKKSLIEFEKIVDHARNEVIRTQDKAVQAQNMLKQAEDRFKKRQLKLAQAQEKSDQKKEKFNQAKSVLLSKTRILELWKNEIANIENRMAN